MVLWVTAGLVMANLVVVLLVMQPGRSGGSSSPVDASDHLSTELPSPGMPEGNRPTTNATPNARSKDSHHADEPSPMRENR